MLAHDEVDNLFRVIRDLTAQGVAVVYISHRLEEIRTIGDRVTVLKDGRTVATGPAGAHHPDPRRGVADDRPHHRVRLPAPAGRRRPRATSCCGSRTSRLAGSFSDVTLHRARWRDRRHRRAGRLRPLRGARDRLRRPPAYAGHGDRRRAGACRRAASRRRCAPASGWPPRSARARRCCSASRSCATSRWPRCRRFARFGWVNRRPGARRGESGRPSRSTCARRTRRRLARTLSGGNQQKVVARPLAARRLPAAAARRADPGRRRRGPVGDLRADPPAGRRGGRRPARLQRGARGARPGRPGAGDARGRGHPRGPGRRARRAPRARHDHGRKCGVSDQMSEPVASSHELAAEVTTDEQARVERAAEVAGESGPLQSRAPQRGAVGDAAQPRPGRRAGRCWPSSAPSPATTSSTSDNIRNILVSSSVIGVVTVGMTFVIIGGGIDLSVGALVALAVVWATTVATQDYGAVAMVACALLVGVGVRARQRRADRLRPARAVHRHAGDAGQRPRSGGQDRRQPDPDRQRCRPSSTSPARTSIGVPMLVVILAVVVAARLGPAQPDHVRPTHVRHRRQPRGSAAGRHRRPPSHRRCSTRCPGCAAASPRMMLDGAHDHRLEHARQPLRARRHRRGRSSAAPCSAAAGAR